MPVRGVVPRHEGVDLGAWPLVGDALKGLGQSGLGVNVVHFACLQTLIVEPLLPRMGLPSAGGRINSDGVL